MEFLHTGSLAAAGLGACCVALDGPRPRVRELALSLAMVLAMFDVVTGAHAVPAVVWSALTMALAMALAVRRRGAGEQSAVARMRLFSGIGAVLMATLMLVMSPGPESGSAHTHGITSGAITAGLLMASAGYAIACGVIMLGGHREISEGEMPEHGDGTTAGAIPVRAVVLDRLQLGSMSGSVLLLAVAQALG